MGSSREIVLWLDERWYDALSCQLEDETVEGKLNDYLDNLISLLPTPVYDTIMEELREEQQRQKQELEAARKYSVFRVTEGGAAECFRVEQAAGLLDFAVYARYWLRQTEQPPFRDVLSDRKRISPEEYDRMAADHAGGDQKITGVYDVDLDAREFSWVRPNLGWLTYRLKDISAASWNAYRTSGYDYKRRQARFLEKLAGREIISAGHLGAENISFAGEIMEEHGQINFYLDSCVNRVFGIRTAGGDDALNAYANYDMAGGQVCDELELTLIRADGHEEALSYPLNAVEKAVLLWKMDDYCQQQTGQSLAGYSAQLMAEDIKPPAGPEM